MQLDSISHPAVALAVKSAEAGFTVPAALILQSGKGSTRRNWARQAAVYLASKSGLSAREIAEVMQCTESSVHHALGEMRARLSVPCWDAEWFAAFTAAEYAFSKKGAAA